MKKYLVSFIIGLIVCSIVFFIWDSSNSIEKNNILLEPIRLPEEILSVDRMVYDNTMGKLILTSKNSDDTYGLWSCTTDFDCIEILDVDHPYGEMHLWIIDDVYYAGINNPARLYRSENFGKTWKNVFHDGIFWSMAHDGDILYGTLWSHNEPLLYRSLDNGNSWELWKDFSKIFPEYAVPYADGGDINKLRHLHDVVVVNENIYVGVGDVIRFTFKSTDNGETWDKIWDDGFTSHIIDAKNNRIILGGDMSHSRGIAVYNIETGETKNVWQPEGTWQGYFFSLVEMNNVYYAATHIEAEKDGVEKYGILESTDGEVWKPILVFEDDIGFSSLFLETDQTDLFVSHNGELFKLRM